MRDGGGRPAEKFDAGQLDDANPIATIEPASSEMITVSRVRAAPLTASATSNPSDTERERAVVRDERSRTRGGRSGSVASSPRVPTPPTPVREQDRGGGVDAVDEQRQSPR